VTNTTRTDVRTLRAAVRNGELCLSASKTVGRRLLEMLFASAPQTPDADGAVWFETGIRVG
jgi:hypothetical protein